MARRVSESTRRWLGLRARRVVEAAQTDRPASTTATANVRVDPPVAGAAGGRVVEAAQSDSPAPAAATASVRVDPPVAGAAGGRVVEAAQSDSPAPATTVTGATDADKDSLGNLDHPTALLHVPATYG